jgi:K+-sensing histidine kinase KdpD
MENPQKIRDKYRVKVYILSIFLTALALGTAVITNIKDQFIIGASIQIGLVIFLFLTIPIVLRKKHIESLSLFVMYLVSLTLLYNASQLGGTDPGPYIGLVALLTITSILTTKKYSFIVYSASIYILFLAMTLLGYANLAITANIKFQAVYVALFVIIMVNRKYLDIREKSIFSLAEKTQKEAITINKKADSLSLEADLLKTQKDQLEEQNKNLSFQKEKLEKTNHIMINREIRMAELKKENEDLKRGKY